MSLNITKFEVELCLLEDLLGTVPKNQKVFSSYLLTKAREAVAKDRSKGIPLASGEANTEESAEEVLAVEPETIGEVEERGWTTFHQDDTGPFLFDYAVKGFLKESARTMKTYKVGKTEVKQLQDKISRYCFVTPRKIYLGAIDSDHPLERPLRAMTAQGPRVTVVRSDRVHAGSKLIFQLSVLKGGQITHNMLADILAYGQFQGLGQWRSGSYGRFEVVRLDRLSGGDDDDEE